MLNIHKIDEDPEAEDSRVNVLGLGSEQNTSCPLSSLQLAVGVWRLLGEDAGGKWLQAPPTSCTLQLQSWHCYSLFPDGNQRVQVWRGLMVAPGQLNFHMPHPLGEVSLELFSSCCKTRVNPPGSLVGYPQKGKFTLITGGR